MSLFEVKYASERKMNKYGIYDLDVFEYKEPIRYEKPTSIYDTYSSENFEETLQQIILNNNREHDANMLVEEESYEGNSVTINEFVKREPESVEEFLEWIKTRLHVKDVSYLTGKEQEEMIEICVQEVKFQWKEIRRNIEDSTLSKEELIEIRRRLYVNVISICEKLFNYYVKRADTLKSREVFSDEANFVRVKTLLACDLKRFMNIHPLKHHLVFDLKRNKRRRDSEQLASAIKPKPNEFLNLKRITVKDLIEDFRLKYKIRGRRYKTIKDHLKDIYDNMPVLETKKIEKMLRKLPQSKVEDKEEEEEEEEIFDQEQDQEETQKVPSEKDKPVEDEFALLSRLSDDSQKSVKFTFMSRSMINLDESSLAEELNLNLTKIVKDRYKTTDLIPHKSCFKPLAKPEIEPFKGRRIDFDQISKENDKTIAIRIKQDLENLTMELKRKKVSLENNDDDQPLLMNLTTKVDQKSRMKEIKSKMKEISKRHKKFLEEIQLPLIKKRTHVQPSTVEIKFFNKFTIRLSDIRVSTRVLRFNVTCELNPPLYNDLANEIDSDMIQHLDRNLFIGGEVKEIYDELLKTVDENHLKFDLDTYVQKAPSKLNYESSFSSSMLKSHGRTKATNQRLAAQSSTFKKPPWDGKNFKEWNKTYLNSFFTQDNNTLKKPLYEQIKLEKSRIKSSKVSEALRSEPKPEKVELYERSDPTKFDSKELKHWYNWWHNNFTSDDYFKYMSTQNSDYLGLLHHLYEDRTNGVVELNEHEARLEEERKRAEKERAEILEELRKKKFSYEQGVWNSNSVLLGGLGNDPVIDENDDPVSRMRKNLENSRPKSKKVQLFRDPDKDDSDEEEKARSKMIELLKDKKTEAPNARLERVWSMLRMSDSEKIDMAIKYCQVEFANKLPGALENWELAADLIVKRERIIFDLENFERFASDPNRYFLKGNKGSSAARLEEAIQREQFYKKIEEVESQLEPILTEIEKEYNDCICYNGRSYLEKMKWDRIEMLHYLTEERRVKHFKHEIRTKHLQANSLVKI